VVIRGRQKVNSKVKNAFQALNNEISLAVLADYEWLMNNDHIIRFCGMSVFEFTSDKKFIKKLSMFYDTAILKGLLDEFIRD
jgi:3-methyladenine DNA glycosylase Tag